MHNIRFLGDTAQLTDEELIYIEDKIVDSVWPNLVGRKLFQVNSIPDVGKLTVRGYKRTDMSQAEISLYGEGKSSKDRSVKSSYDVTVPVIAKNFMIRWRDLEASRNSGQPLDMQDARTQPGKSLKKKINCCFQASTLAGEPWELKA